MVEYYGEKARTLPPTTFFSLFARFIKAFKVSDALHYYSASGVGRRSSSGISHSVTWTGWTAAYVSLHHWKLVHTGQPAWNHGQTVHSVLGAVEGRRLSTPTIPYLSFIFIPSSPIVQPSAIPYPRSPPLLEIPPLDPCAESVSCPSWSKQSPTIKHFSVHFEPKI